MTVRHWMIDHDCSLLAGQLSRDPLGSYNQTGVMPDIILYSPYPPEECKRRLAAIEGISARITDDGFRLSTSLVSLSFVPVLDARLIETPEGSRIEGSFRTHPVVLLGIPIWLALMAAIGLVPLNAVLVIGLVAFGLVIVGRSIGQKNRQEILESVRRHLEATGTSYAAA